MTPASGARRVLVFAGGDFRLSDLDVLEDDPGSAFCVCVDSGLMHCLAANLHPHLLVGDMDSVPRNALRQAEIASVPRLLYSNDKNASDLELALLVLAGEIDTTFLVVGRTPERADEQADEPACTVGNGTPMPPNPEDTLNASSDLQDVRNIASATDGLDEVVIVGLSGGRTDHLLFNWLLPAKRIWPFRLRLLDHSSDALVVHADCPLQLDEHAGRTLSLIPLSLVEGVMTEGLRYPLGNATLEPGTTLGLSNVTTGGKLSVTVRQGRLLVIRVRSSQE